MGVDVGTTFTEVPLEFVREIEFTVIPKAMIQSAGASPRLTWMGVAVGVGAGEDVPDEADEELPPLQPIKPKPPTSRSAPAANRVLFRSNMSSSWVEWGTPLLDAARASPGASINDSSRGVPTASKGVMPLAETIGPDLSTGSGPIVPVPDAHLTPWVQRQRAAAHQGGSWALGSRVIHHACIHRNAHHSKGDQPQLKRGHPSPDGDIPITVEKFKTKPKE